MGTLSGKAIIRSMMCVFSSKSPNYLDLSCETDIDSFIVSEGKNTLLLQHIYIFESFLMWKLLPYSQIITVQ